VIFRTKMKSDYTIIGAVEKQRSNKTAVVAVAGFFVLAAVLALASVSGLSQGELRVSSNVQTVSSELKLEFEKVCKSSDTRYVVAVFDGTEIVPCVSGPATDHWEQDYAKFEAAIERCVGLSSHSIAFAVYNMPVWKTADHHTYVDYPTFIDYVAPGVDMADIYWAGTYLGATKLAASCVTASVKIDRIEGEGSRMVETCQKIGKDDESMMARCQSIQTVDCPYVGDNTPCQNKPCQTDLDGEAFAAISSLGEECCDAIAAWCKKEVDVETKPGCGNFAHKQIYTHNCAGGFEAPVVAETILHPVLVAEEAARQQEIADAKAAEEKKAADQKAADEKKAADQKAADQKAAEEKAAKELAATATTAEGR